MDPLSTSLPLSRLKKIFSIIKPDFIFCDSDNFLKIKKIKTSSLDEKF